MVPDIGISNGVMSVVLNYAKAMPEGVIFDVMYFQETPENRKAEIEALGGRVFKVDKPSPKDVVSKKYDSFFTEHKGEWAALHIHAPHFAIFIAPSAKRSGIKKIAMHCHSTWYSLFNSNKKRNKMLYDLGKNKVDKKFACGYDAGMFWYKNENNFTVLPNAVNCEAFRFNSQLRTEKRKELGIDGKFVVGHLGRTSPPQKNHHFLFKVFAEIKKHKPDSALLLVGAGADDDLLKLAKELGIENEIFFLGARKDVNELCQAMDVFVFPSFWEGLPVSVVEAQASGLPVVMSDSVTNEVKVLETTCIMSLNESAEKWAEKAIELASNERKDSFEQMKISGWDISTQAEKLYNYYCGD